MSSGNSVSKRQDSVNTQEKPSQPPAPPPQAPPKPPNASLAPVFENFSLVSQAQKGTQDQSD